MDSFKLWLAALTGEVVDRCHERSKADCPACVEGLTSPLLHLHMLHSLRELLQKNFAVCVQEINVEELFKNFAVRFGLFQLIEKDYIAIGQHFLLTLNADVVYYGRYITAEYDQALYKEIPVQTYQPTPVPEEVKVDKTKKKRKTAN